MMIHLKLKPKIMLVCIATARFVIYDLGITSFYLCKMSGGLFFVPYAIASSIVLNESISNFLNNANISLHKYFFPPAFFNAA